MTEFQIASDLHLEIISESKTFSDLIEPVAPILLLCGDIGNPSTDRYVSFLEWCSDNFETVVAIACNHEFYSSACMEATLEKL